MSDPEWTAEFTVRNNKTGASREVRIDSPDPATAMAAALRAMGAVFDAEMTAVARQIERAFEAAGCGGSGG